MMEPRPDASRLDVPIFIMLLAAVFFLWQRTEIELLEMRIKASIPVRGCNCIPMNVKAEATGGNVTINPTFQQDSRAEQREKILRSQGLIHADVR